MSTIGVVIGRISTMCVADTIVVRMVVGMISWTSGGINEEFAGNNDAKGVEIVGASRCCSGSWYDADGVSGCTMS